MWCGIVRVCIRNMYVYALAVCCDWIRPKWFPLFLINFSSLFSFLFLFSFFILLLISVKWIEIQYIYGGCLKGYVSFALLYLHGVPRNWCKSFDDEEDNNDDDDDDDSSSNSDSGTMFCGMWFFLPSSASIHSCSFVKYANGNSLAVCKRDIDIITSHHTTPNIHSFCLLAYLQCKKKLKHNLTHFTEGK